MSAPKTSARLLIACVLVVMLSAATVASAYVIPMVEKRLTISSATQDSPAISGTKVVYRDQRNGNSDVYLFDLATNTERRLTTDSSDQYAPAISGNKVVYEDGRRGNSDIYLYDLATGVERRLTTNTAHQWSAAISGTKVVYEDDRNGNYDIYLYDLATNTERRLTTNAGTQYAPAISGTKVVYQDDRNGKWDVYLYDLATNTERRLTTNVFDQYRPAISGTKVVYNDYRNGNFDIYLYDLATNTEKRLTTNTTNQFSPAISGTKVVYNDYRHGNLEIYLYDLETGSETRLTNQAANQEYSAIDGSRIVYQDNRSGNQDIYLGELALPRISASAPSVVSYKGAPKLTGTLTSITGIPLAGRSVGLEVSTDGVSWSAAGTATTGSGGAYSLTAPALTSARHLRANFRGGSGYLSAPSDARVVKPKVYLTRPSFGRTTLAYGTTYKATGYLKPRHKAGAYPVKIAAYRYENGKYRWKKTYSAKAFDYSSYTKYVRSIKLPSKGKWRLRAVHAADSLNATTYSSWRYVTVK